MSYTLGTMYRDRIDAGEQLAAALTGIVDQDDRPLILGIPRGGVPVAAVVADQLGGDLDVPPLAAVHIVPEGSC